jgi:sec-independent protein translocase protein TatB
MLNLDPGKLLVIAVVAIILLGPDRLPQVARQVGGAWRSFNEFRHRMESEVRSSMPDLPSTSEIARLARSPSALLNHLSTMSEDGTEEAAQTAGAEGAPSGENGAEAAAEAAVGVADETETAGGNGSHPAAGDNGSAGTPAQVTTPREPVTPPPATRSPQSPAPRAPETTVPVDPSLN